MRVTFDSNTWEKIFDPIDRDWSSIRSAIASGRIAGFVCEAGFRIEAIRKNERATYFAEPAMDVRLPFSIVMRDGQPYVHLMSIGPEDESHPGLPEVQSNKLKNALAADVRLMRGGRGWDCLLQRKSAIPRSSCRPKIPTASNARSTPRPVLKPAASERLHLTPLQVGTRKPAYLTMKRYLPKHVLNGPMEN
jgi:hypothetical protein